MRKPASILISCCRPFKAIELTIQSILKRTNYSNYKIIVNDQSGGQGVGNKRQWLRQQEKEGNIGLVETHRSKSSLDGHGAGIRTLLEHCDTEYAMLFSSDIEIREDGKWLDVAVDILENDDNPETVLGVAEFKPGGNHFNQLWILPRYIPCWMLLNMPAYRKFQESDDWDLSFATIKESPYSKLFEGQSDPKNNQKIFRDTGWKLYERISFYNPGGFRMLSLPHGYSVNYLNHIGGIDRNSFRSSSDFMKQKIKYIEKRLKKLRKE